MSDDMPRLVLRRTAEEDENKIAVRLAPDVDRTADLYELFSEGIIIEILDVELEGGKGLPEVTLGLNAPPAFRFDRTGRIRHPRRSDVIGGEESLVVHVTSREDVEKLSMEDLEKELERARDVAQKLRGQQIRLKRDKSKAVDRGYRNSSDKRHHEWLMLIEEMDIISEQMRAAEGYAAMLNNVHKTRRQSVMSRRRESFESNFIRLVKDKLSAKDFESLRDEAQRIANDAVPDDMKAEKQKAS